MRNTLAFFVVINVTKNHSVLHISISCVNVYTFYSHFSLSHTYTSVTYVLIFFFTMMVFRWFSDKIKFMWMHLTCLLFIRVGTCSYINTSERKYVRKKKYFNKKFDLLLTAFLMFFFSINTQKKDVFWRKRKIIRKKILQKWFEPETHILARCG